MPKTSANAERGMDGVEKAAILLIALGPEKSAQIFKHLKEEEIEQLTLEIANTSSVSPQTKEQVLNEFYEVCLAFEGDVYGMMMFLFDTKSAHHLVNTLMMQDTESGIEADTQFNDMEMSALNEIGNIVSGSYLTAISKLTNLKMVSTVPEMTIDMIGALLSVPASEFGKYGDKLLLIQSQFGELDFVNGYFLMIPELESYDKLLESLGV